MIPDRVGRVLNLFHQWLAYVENVTNTIAGVLIFLLMCLGVARIVCRLLDIGMFGYIDIVELSMVGFAVLSIAFVQRIGTHVRMELILSMLKGRWLWAVEAIAASIGVFIVWVLIPSSYKHFHRAFEFGDSTMDIELVTWPAKLVVPVALSILLLRMLIQLCGYLRLVWNPNLEPIAIPVIQPANEKVLSEVASPTTTSTT